MNVNVTVANFLFCHYCQCLSRRFRDETFVTAFAIVVLLLEQDVCRFCLCLNGRLLLQLHNHGCGKCFVLLHLKSSVKIKEILGARQNSVIYLTIARLYSGMAFLVFHC